MLANDTQTVYFEGVVDSSDLDTCVEVVKGQSGETEGVANVEQREDSDGPLGETRKWAFLAVYNLTFTSDSGEEIQFAEYIDCRPIVEGESIL